MMEKLGREQHSLGTIAEGKHQMVPLSSSSAGGSLLSQLILLRAAIDGDLRLFKEMVLCLDKGQGGAATVAAVSYKGVGALHIAVRMGRTLIMEYLEHELGLDTTGIIDNSGHLSEKLSLKEHIDHIIHEIISQLPQAQEHKSITMQTPILSWEDLQSDMIREIACAFSSAEVYCTARSVCKKWAAALKGSPPLSLHRSQIPFLLLPPMELTKPYTIWKLRNRNSPACDACHLSHLDSATGNFVVGSSFGWVFMLDPAFLSLFLLNPITGERIMLPSLWALYGKFVDSSKLVRHAVLSSDPSFSNCWLILVFLTTDDSSFFSYRYGSHGWTQHMHEECVAEDVVYFVDRFVALTEDGRLALLCVDAADPPVQFVHFEEKLPEGRRYLVVGSSEQELLLVTTSDLDSPQVTPGHIPLIERLLISSEFVRRTVSDTSGSLFLAHGSSVTVGPMRIPPSVGGGVFWTQTYLRSMGSKGRIRCGGVIRTMTPMTPVANHDIMHAQIFSSSNDMWLTQNPWWVAPNIFQSVPKPVRLPLHNHHSGISSHEGKESHGSSGNQMQLNSQFAAKAQIQVKKVSETHSEREKVD